MIQERMLIHKSHYTGLEHMITDDSGNIYIDIFEQTKGGLVHTLKKARQSIEDDNIKIKLKALEVPEALDEIINELEDS
jgi:hypothetical protein